MEGNFYVCETRAKRHAPILLSDKGRGRREGFASEPPAAGHLAKDSSDSCRLSRTFSQPVLQSERSPRPRLNGSSRFHWNQACLTAPACSFHLTAFPAPLRLALQTHSNRSRASWSGFLCLSARSKCKRARRFSERLALLSVARTTLCRVPFSLAIPRFAATPALCSTHR